MWNSLSGRIIALGLLAVLPAVASGRLALDVRASFHDVPGAHIEHCECGDRSHDHRLCLLVLHTPWLQAVADDFALRPAPPRLIADGASAIFAPQRTSLEVARSPPTHA